MNLLNSQFSPHSEGKETTFRVGLSLCTLSFLCFILTALAASVAVFRPLDGRSEIEEKREIRYYRRMALQIAIWFGSLALGTLFAAAIAAWCSRWSS